MDDLWEDPWAQAPPPFESWPDEPGPETPEAEETVHTDDIKADLLQRFSDLLDEALSDEEPEGIAEEIWQSLDPDESDEPDLYTLWSAMTSLTQEVKLQGRSFKQLSETLTPVGDLSQQLPDVLRAHDEAIAAANALSTDRADTERQQREQHQKSLENMMRKEFFDLMLDLRDRLKRGMQTATDQNQIEVPPAGAFARLFARPQIEAAERLADMVAATEKGYRLTLDRLNEALQTLGINEIICEGQSFDPSRMNAVDIEECEDAIDGKVLEVYRPGYEWNGNLLRTAEVKVARRK
jgi:molecular chaperone GrpE